MVLFILFIVILFSNQTIFSQPPLQLTKNQLLGEHRFERDCFDVIHYDLTLMIDSSVSNRQIKGKNSIQFIVTEDTDVLQIDLASQFSIDSIQFNHTNCEYQKVENSLFIKLPEKLKKGEKHELSIQYQGTPLLAKQAPWDGGFVYKKDTSGNPFIGVACEGIGAHSWWPCKDLLSDRCDSMDIHIVVPSGLDAIANGKLVKKEENPEINIFHWKVTYPIANYNISVTIGKFAHFQEVYKHKKTTYPIDYYVLTENLEIAKKHFKQVKPMLKTYEKFLGPYPFANDGFKIIEAPYLGMEHQSAVAYGNGYQNGYNGRYFSPISKKFDFIIIHESGHEYWGNNIGMNDRSDMWINEGFCTYSELLYVEKQFGKKYTTDYMNYWKQVIQNQEAIVNERYSNLEPTVDIYYKGALLIHTLRYLLNNDRLFFFFLKEIQRKYAHQTMDTETMIKEFSSLTKSSFEDVFHVFLNQASPAILNHTLTPTDDGNYRFRFKWDAVEKLTMPIEFRYGKKRYKIDVTEKWGEMTLPKKGNKHFEIDESKTYFIIKYE